MASRSGYLAIQSIAIPYIDDQRRGATKRTRMHGFPLPPPDDREGMFHEMRCDLRQGTPPTSVTHAFAPRADGDLVRVGELRFAFHELNLAFIGPTPWSSKPAFLVPHGAWGRVIWSEKDRDADHEWRVEHIVNAGWFDTPPKRSIFRGLPTVERDLRRDTLRTGTPRGASSAGPRSVIMKRI